MCDVSHGLMHQVECIVVVMERTVSSVVLPVRRFILAVHGCNARMLALGFSQYAVLKTIARFAPIARPNDQTSKTNTSLRRRPHALDMWRILRILSRTRAELAGEF
jgi:hypothetical protein